MLRRKEFAFFSGIVVNEVHARAYADLKNLSLSQRHDALTNRLDKLRVPQRPYKMGIDMISVKGHCYISRRSVMFICDDGAPRF
jgi:hypothetical protein